MLSLSLVNDKAYPAASTDEVFKSMALALSLVEVYLPASELDIKLHDCLHLAERLPQLGPNHTTAMWAYEGYWSYLKRLMKKHDTPEVTCMLSLAVRDVALAAGEKVKQDLEFSDRLLSSQAARPDSLQNKLQNYWAYVNDPSHGPTVTGDPYHGRLSTASKLQIPLNEQCELILMYAGHDSEFGLLWQAFVNWLWGQWQTDTTVRGWGLGGRRRVISQCNAVLLALLKMQVKGVQPCPSI